MSIYIEGRVEFKSESAAQKADDILYRFLGEVSARQEEIIHVGGEIASADDLNMALKEISGHTESGEISFFDFSVISSGEEYGIGRYVFDDLNREWYFESGQIIYESDIDEIECGEKDFSELRDGFIRWTL